MLKKLLYHLSKEWLFYLSLFLFLLSSLFFHRVPRITPDEWKVLFNLAVFLVIINGLKSSGILGFAAWKVERGKGVPLKLVFLTFFLSMFVTNDVALLVVVPITVAMSIEDRAKVVIMEAIAANGGSALTPFGNPQNLFIYYHYMPSPVEFLKTIFPLVLVTAFLLFIFSPKSGKSLEGDEIPFKTFKKRDYLYLFFFLLFILVVLGTLSEWLGTVPFLYALLFQREVLKIDCFLLLTFLCFFGFTDNLSHHFRFFLDNSLEVFLYSALGSQVVSNVPSALFFSEFTGNWKALLWGVSVGGFGNLVGSMANLIAYRLYAEREGDGRFLLRFHLYGYLFFSVGVFLFLFLFGLK